jgi:membrane associated rhomboid family serine protease
LAQSLFISLFERDHTAKGPLRMVWALILAFGLVYALELASDGGLDRAVADFGFVPGSPSFAGLWASIFMHAGLLHLLGNSFFLWMYGDNIEERLGPWNLLALFLLTALAATLAHWAAEPGSLLPTVGASGGISGLMGFYAVKFPNATLVAAITLPFGRRRRLIPVGQMRAWVAMLLWLGSQLLAGFYGLYHGRSGVLGVAVWAHIGGALCGVALAFAGLKLGLMMQHPKAGIFVERKKGKRKAKTASTPGACPSCGKAFRPGKRRCGACGRERPWQWAAFLPALLGGFFIGAGVFILAGLLAQGGGSVIPMTLFFQALCGLGIFAWKHQGPPEPLLGLLAGLGVCAAGLLALLLGAQ